MSQNSLLASFLEFLGFSIADTGAKVTYGTSATGTAVGPSWVAIICMLIALGQFLFSIYQFKQRNKETTK